MMRPVAIALILLNASCFSYHPVSTTGGPAPTSAIRVRLSTPGTFDIGEVVVQNVVEVEGELIGWSGDTLSLSATLLTSGTRQEFFGNARTVSIGRSQIASLEQRRLSIARSALLAGAGLLFISAADRVIGAIGGTSGDGPDNGTPTR